MRIELKRKLFKDGLYGCRPPDCDTSKWTISQWIDWIDKNGTWWK